MDQLASEIKWGKNKCNQEALENDWNLINETVGDVEKVQIYLSFHEA